MFILTDKTKKNCVSYFLYDTKDVADAVIGITGSEREGEIACIAASGMEFGSSYSARDWRLSVVQEVRDELLKHLCAEQVNDNTYIIHLSNGKEIKAEMGLEYRGAVFAWKIDNQYFDNDGYALNYLKRLVVEKLTGVRIVLHKKMTVPNICGVDGCACRHPGKCNTALCFDCPVAEAYFAERDGMELVYAV